MRKLILYIALLFSPGLFGQWENASFEQLAKDIEGQSKLTGNNALYSFRCTYDLFEFYDDQKPKFSYTGYFVKYGMYDYYYEQFGRIILQNQKFKLTVDTAERIIVLSEPDSMFLSANGLDIEQQKRYYKSVQRNQIAGVIKYAFEYQPGTQYSGSEIWIGSDQYIRKMIYYAAQTIENGEENPKMIKPRMEINFMDYRMNPKTTGLPVASKYVTIQPGKASLTAAYSGFELIDLRKIEKR